MAGIGFELKKLFKDSGFFSNIRAYAYSALVSLGPFLLCTIVIVAIIQFMGYMEVSFKDKELFIASVVYAFIFSQIIASIFKMMITRFIADMLYSEKFEYIMPSLYGVLSIAVPLSGIIGILFLWNSPLQLEFKLIAYLLYMELVIVFIIMEYLSTLKDYMKIVKSFLWGIGTILVLSFVLLRFTNLQDVFGLLLAMDIGFFIIIVSLMIFLRNFFGKSVNKYFEFMKHFDKYPSLFFIAFFYTLGLYVHNFLFWTGELGVRIAGTYIYAPTYDVPTFYAFLSIMPSMIVFVVSIETSFYDKYKAYYTLITGKGNLTDIENAKKDMTRTLWSEIRNIMEIQLFFTLVFIAAGSYVLPKIGLTQLSIDIFNVLAVGAYFNILMLIIILILLYFEDRRGAFTVSAVFLLSNTVFTYITMNYSENTYGLGFFFAALLGVIVAVIRLVVYLKNINYHTFCGQPIIYKEIRGFFTHLVDFFTPRREREIQQETKTPKIPFLFITGLLILSFLSFSSCTHSDYDSLMSTDYDTNSPGTIVADKNSDNDNDEDDDNGTVLQAEDTKEEVQKKIPPAAFDNRDSLIYALQKVNYEMLASAEFDVAVVDPDDSKLDKYDIDGLHSKDKSIIAYLSIGEAENYRNYWVDDWETGNPSFLEEENPNWIGNFKVKYWDSDWQEIIFELLSQIIGKGYDGVYLDLVDVYTYFTERGYPDARLQMIDFVLEISKYAKEQKKDFLIVPQNAEELIAESEYLDAIDGVGRENLWFVGDNPQNKNESDTSIGYLNQIIEAGKFVFVISYSKEEENIKSFITLAQNHGFIPYVGPVELDRIENIDNYSE